MCLLLLGLSQLGRPGGWAPPWPVRPGRWSVPRGSSPMDAAVQLEATHFEPVDGGSSRACRGADSSDNSPIHYLLTIEASLIECMASCLTTLDCQGVEFRSADGRCELWMRPLGIEASVAVEGFECFRRPSSFEAVDGGMDRACRGADPSDEAAEHFEAMAAASLEECKSECLLVGGCRGVDFAAALQACRLWTRTAGIQATQESLGHLCLRRTDVPTSTTTATSTRTSSTSSSATATLTSTTPSLVFEPVNGGMDRVCRGASSGDNDASYYEVTSADELQGCQGACIERSGCTGVEYNAGSRRCEVWIRPEGIGATLEATGFECWRAVSPVTVTATATVTTTTTHTITTTSSTTTSSTTGSTTSTAAPPAFDPIDGAVGRACRGSDAGDNKVEYYLAVEAATLQRCQERCLKLSKCNAVEFSSSRCELWIRPEGVEATAKVSGYQCWKRASLSSSNHTQTKYVMHYMPWFLGDHPYPSCSADPDCKYRQDHWCSSYGNSYYASALGAYDLMQHGVIGQQLDLMKDAGIDGVWVDYQLTAWDKAIDLLVHETGLRGMGIAVVVDSAVNKDIFMKSRAKLLEWTSASNYYRQGGIPIIPVFNDASILFDPLPIDAIYLARREVQMPAWANGTFPWITSDLDYLEAYHRADWGSAPTVGAAYRGFRDCYEQHSYTEPGGFVGKLGLSLEVASKYEPDFVQLLTWNDYSEGTMLEPSWVRLQDECVDVCEARFDPCRTTSDCYHDHQADCLKPYGAPSAPPQPGCAATVGNLSARADLDLVKEHIAALAAGGPEAAAQEVIFK